MRIAIVNDMPLAVEALRRTLSMVPEHRLVWVARDGIEAVEACLRERPDLILMDLVMPRMDGVEATRRIMAATPCAILIVTVNVGTNTALVFEAMGFGALDAVDTPVFGADPSGGASLLTKIETLRRLIGETNPVAHERALHASVAPSRAGALLAIGASAGGPAALAKLLSGLPTTFGGAIVIVQHIDEHFARTMAAWLDEQTELSVRVACEGDRPEAGTALLAGANAHLAFKSSARIGYTSEPATAVYQPSIDVFFESAGRFWRGGIVGVLLTGMGRDGALGLKALRDDGRHTISQDRASSAVYGMPKAAAALDAAVDILPLDRIAPRLIDLFAEKSRQVSCSTHE